MIFSSTPASSCAVARHAEPTGRVSAFRVAETRWNRTDLVERGEDVAEVGDRPARLVHLVEDVVAEEFDEVAVARLCPSRVVVEPAEGQSSVSPYRDRGETASGIQSALVAKVERETLTLAAH